MCANNQVAYCIIENGEVKGGCYTAFPPSGPSPTSSAPTKSEMTEKLVEFLSEWVSPQYASEMRENIAKIEKSQSYTSIDRKYSLRFSTPKMIQEGGSMSA